MHTITAVLNSDRFCALAESTFFYSQASNKHAGWNKRVLLADFCDHYMKKRLLLHKNKRAGGAKAQKSISEAARLLDR